MDIRQKIQEIAAETGFSASGYAAIPQLSYHPEIRKICEENTCRNFGTSWACPPAVGTLAECEARVRQYDSFLLLSRVYALEDSFDFEGMGAGLRDFKGLVDALQQKLDGILSGYLLLSNEGCGRCAACTYPDAPCRFPQRLHHSLEGYGFVVNELAEAAGLRYHNGANTVTFFGALLFCSSAGGCA